VTNGRVPAAAATVTSVLRGAAARHADGVFLDFGGERHRYGEMWTQATGLARGLRAVGVGPGDTVAVMLDNNLDNLAAWYGANLLNAIWVGVNTALRGEFLRHVVADSGAKVIICEAEFVPRLAAVAGRLGAAAPLVLVRGEPAAGSDELATCPLDAVRLDGPDTGWHEAAEDDVSMLVYTGGTTGPSKGCVIAHGYVLNLCRRYIESTGRTAGELNWSPLPMFHFNLLALTVTSSAWLGGTAAIAPRFSVSGFWPEVERTGARIVNLLGSMGSLIAQMPDSDAMKRCYGQLRVVHGAPFSAEVQQIWHERFGAEMVGGAMYGLTEAVPLTLPPPGGADGPPGTSGRRNEADFEVRIVDDADRELGPGQVGEIVARPQRPNVMFQGYWRRPEATVAATRNLWFHSGDLGTFDAAGFFTFVDRKKDYLRRRGENISSVELETAFLEHPDIEQVAVHSVPSELSEDDVKVTVVLATGSALTARELFEWSKERVPYFALPRYIEFRPVLPASPTGRVLKYQLRAEGRTPDTWDREEDDVTWERR
jgi:carnitine-CoA ligase